MSSHITSRVIASPPSPIVPPHVSPHHQPFYAHDALGIPLGKYYPSNYKYLVSTTAAAAVAAAAAAAAAPVPDISGPLLSMDSDTAGLWCKKRAANKKVRHKSHDQKASEMKLQQYQREMISQARNAVKERNSSIRKPPPPPPERMMLHPIETDYGGITPFELAGTETSGYVTEGERKRFERQQIATASGSENVDEIKERRLVKIISST